MCLCNPQNNTSHVNSARGLHVTLTINKKHLTYTLISVTVVWSLILMQSLHEDIVHQSHHIASNLDNSVNASAKQLSEQLQTIEQISDGVTAQLYTLDHLSEEQKFKSAEVLFNAFPEITGICFKTAFRITRMATNCIRSVLKPCW